MVANRLVFPWPSNMLESLYRVLAALRSIQDEKCPVFSCIQIFRLLR